ncbi:MAG: hypothetical protein A2020_01875 [Lentisphaerae bacterium GWF2_45_14]|nr:MAG: hypothetical protein A2020_01875 [Lentisphaerae bacterium GWF2_45_14]
MRKEILERFRDDVLGLMSARPPTVQSAAESIVIFAGKPDLALASTVRDSLPQSTLLLYLYSGPSDKSLISAFQSKHGLTLFSSLSPEEFPHEKAGILVSLWPDKRVSVKVDGSLEKAYEQTIAKINEAVGSAVSNARQSSSGGLIYLRSSLGNLRSVFSSGRKMLKNQDPSIPAVICCGGPSFAEAIPFIKEYSGKIAVFSMARTCSTLISSDVIPDVIIHVDPFYDISWCEKASEKNCILAATLSVFPSLAEKFHDIIWFYGDSSAMNSYVRNQAPGLLNEIFLSKTVTVSAIDMAVKAGFKKIILTGSDLCLAANGSSHVDASSTSGTVYLFPVDAVDGGKVFTSREFDVLRKAIEAYVEDVLPKDVEIYNGGSSGALIKNIPNIAIDKFLLANARSDKKLFIETCQRESQMPFSIEQISDDLKKLVAHNALIISAAESLCRAAGGGNQKRITQCQDIFNRLLGKESALTQKKDLGYFTADIGAFVDDIMNFLPELRFIDLEDPLTKLILFTKRRLLTNDLYCDILSDIENDQCASLKSCAPRIFTAFRNFALRFISAKNPRLAEYISTLSPEKGLFDSTFSLQSLPNIVRFKGEAHPLFSYSVFEHEEKAREFASSLAEKYSFDPQKNSLIFPAPGNYLNIVETAKKYPLADIMIVERWPELLSQLISSAMFFHLLPEKTVVACASPEFDDLAGLAASTIKCWKDAGRRVIIVGSPETSRLGEVVRLTESLNEL